MLMCRTLSVYEAVPANERAGANSGYCMEIVSGYEQANDLIGSLLTGD